MSLYGALAGENHFEEFGTPLVTAAGVVSAATRKATALANLGLTATAAELNAVDGNTSTADELSMLDISASDTPTAGAVTTGATTVAVEKFDTLWRTVKLTMTAFAIGTSDDNAALAIGAKFYTLPAGAVVVRDLVIKGGITAAISVTTDTPEVGVGSVIGSGASATLSTTMEDYVDGGAAGLIGGDTVAPNVAGGALIKGMLSTSAQGVLVKSSGGKSHDMYLNVAATWANVTAAGAVTFDGTITFRYRVLA